jgi:hypothetical protein
MSDVNELKTLDENTRKAVSRVAAEYKYAKDLEKELEKIEGEEDPKKANKEVKNAFHILRWVGRAERRVDHDEKKILKGLEEIGEILPENLKTKEEKLHEKLEDAEQKVVTLSSMFTGKVKKELKDIKLDESLLEEYEKNSKKTEEIRVHLRDLLKDVEIHVKELITWIEATVVILRQIEGFEETLDKLSKS